MDDVVDRTAGASVPTVLVIGDVMLDVIAAPERPIAIATDTPATINVLAGGSGANQAAWLGHFGNAVRFVGRVGGDTYALHLAALRAHGVHAHLARDEQTRSGMCVTLIGSGGERSFLTDRGANVNLESADFAPQLLDGVDLVHISGYALFSPGPRAAVREYVALARARGIPYSVDCGSVAFLSDVGAPAFLDWTTAASMCFANAAEATLLAGTSEPAEQFARLSPHFQALIVTAGAAGARALTASRRQYVSVRAPVVDAVDATGAGDAFLAGFLTGHLRGEHLEECLHRAVRAGSSAVLTFGGRPKAASHDHL